MERMKQYVRETKPSNFFTGLREAWGLDKKSGVKKVVPDVQTPDTVRAVGLAGAREQLDPEYRDKRLTDLTEKIQSGPEKVSPLRSPEGAKRRRKNVFAEAAAKIIQAKNAFWMERNASVSDNAERGSESKDVKLSRTREETQDQIIDTLLTPERTSELKGIMYGEQLAAGDNEKAWLNMPAYQRNLFIRVAPDIINRIDERLNAYDQTDQNEYLVGQLATPIDPFEKNRLVGLKRHIIERLSLVMQENSNGSFLKKTMFATAKTEAILALAQTGEMGKEQFWKALDFYLTESGIDTSDKLEVIRAIPLENILDTHMLVKQFSNIENHSSVKDKKKLVHALFDKCEAGVNLSLPRSGRVVLDSVSSYNAETLWEGGRPSELGNTVLAKLKNKIAAAIQSDWWMDDKKVAGRALVLLSDVTTRDGAYSEQHPERVFSALPTRDASFMSPQLIRGIPEYLKAQVTVERTNYSYVSPSDADESANATQESKGSTLKKWWNKLKKYNEKPTYLDKVPVFTYDQEKAKLLTTEMQRQFGVLYSSVYAELTKPTPGDDGTALSAKKERIIAFLRAWRDACRQEMDRDIRPTINMDEYDEELKHLEEKYDFTFARKLRREMGNVGF